ncbi:DUF7503 family protein [Candidatus Halobonum tyrrellensis]|nr:hypothetical protein [Candidatus Halobonum tyrrellensis]
MSDNPIKAYLAEHPKACGIVFTMCMLLASASNAAAIASANNGP